MYSNQNLVIAKKNQSTEKIFLSLKSRLRELELFYNLSPKLTKSQIKQLQLQFSKIVNVK
jgi:hypothetical protein